MRNQLITLMILCFGVLSGTAQNIAGSDTTKSLGFDGPSSVSGQIERDATHETKFMKGYFDFKSRLKENTGLSYGIDFNSMVLYSNSSRDTSTAAGGAFRVYLNWELVGRKSGNTGSFIAKVENRHAYGKQVPPQDLGSDIGYVGLVAVPFSNIKWALTNFYWNQNLLKDRLSFVVGALDATDYTNVYGLVDPWNDFYNLAFSNDPTIPAPNQGLGMAIRGILSKHLYLLGSITDANGDPTDPLNMFDSFFNTSEYFTSFEFGWIKTYDRRYTDNIHLTYWYADPRKEANVLGGWGLAFSYNQLFNENWQPFFRAAYAKDGGALWEASLSAGVGYNISPIVNQIGFGLNWGRPSESSLGSNLNDQITAELYCRLHLWKILTITPDVQVLINPAMNPTEDLLAVFGVRSRIPF